MKAFFEEYGMVLVVTVIATAMIAFATGFQETMTDTLENQWDKMTNAEVS